jgi:hypothetical protein
VYKAAVELEGIDTTVLEEEMGEARTSSILQQ